VGDPTRRFARAHQLTMTLDRLTDPAPRPDPIVHPEVEGFWSGLEAGELRVQICDRCRTHRVPFAPVCFRCRSFEFSWEGISPEGTIASAVVVERATGEKEWSAYVPFISGLVDLERGLRLPGRIACTCGQAMQRGAPVRAVIMTAPGLIPVQGFAHSCVPPER
jgi:uncharacterized OB-fold protein